MNRKCQDHHKHPAHKQVLFLVPWNDYSAVPGGKTEWVALRSSPRDIRLDFNEFGSVWIELNEVGVPIVRIFASNASDEPTHTISLIDSHHPSETLIDTGAGRTAYRCYDELEIFLWDSGLSNDDGTRLFSGHITKQGREPAKSNLCWKFRGCIVPLPIPEAWQALADKAALAAIELARAEGDNEPLKAWLPTGELETCRVRRSEFSSWDGDDYE